MKIEFIIKEATDFTKPSKFKSYYDLNQLKTYLNREPTINDILFQWVKNNNQLYDENTHGLFQYNDVLRYREYDRKTNSRNTPEENQQIKLSLQKHGWQQNNPGIITLNKSSNKAILGEGNHRLMLMNELGLTNSLIPIRFLFYT